MQGERLKPPRPTYRFAHSARRQATRCSGQSARIRLDGFPWTQFGSLTATVTQVAGEVRDGRVRVELVVHPTSDSRIPMEHGLPGTVEVEIERVSPATLVLRAAGKLVTRTAERGDAG